MGDNRGTLILPCFLVAGAMDVDKSAKDLVASQPRLPITGDASLLVLKHECRVACRGTDLSMGGRRIETEKEFRAGNRTHFHGGSTEIPPVLLITLPVAPASANQVDDQHD